MVRMITALTLIGFGVSATTELLFPATKATAAISGIGLGMLLTCVIIGTVDAWRKP